MASHIKIGVGLLMDCLIALGGTKGFGVPGESYLAVLDAMYDPWVSVVIHHCEIHRKSLDVAQELIVYR